MAPVDSPGHGGRRGLHQYLSSAKVRWVLGWAPTHGMDAGLARTVEWYRGHLGARPPLAA